MHGDVLFFSILPVMFLHCRNVCMRIGSFLYSRSRSNTSGLGESQKECTRSVPRGVGGGDNTKLRLRGDGGRLSSGMGTTSMGGACGTWNGTFRGDKRGDGGGCIVFVGNNGGVVGKSAARMISTNLSELKLGNLRSRTLLI